MNDIKKNSQKSKVIEFLKEFRHFIDKSPWRTRYSNQLYAMEDKLSEPCILAIAGRVKAGKSSFLNALLGKKLAIVGVNETTATINMFRKRNATDDATHEVKVIWEDGSVSYEDYAFMERLQGTNKEVLDLASQIRRVEYITDDDLLDKITLVDTPGTDAENSSHEETVEGYFELRKKHTNETQYYTDTADAIIYLTGWVANKSNEDFLREFAISTGKTSSSLNSIGVLARTDELPFSERNKLPMLVNDIQNGLKDYLNVVIPVSSCLWDVINRGDFELVLKKLCDRVSEVDKSCIDFITNRVENFLRDDDGERGLSVYMERKGLDSKVLAVLCKGYREELYNYFGIWSITKLVIDFAVEYKYDVDTIKQKLYEYSGIWAVKEKVYEHFFDRAETIKCFHIMSELSSIIEDINRFGLSSLKTVARQKNSVIERIATLPRETYDWILANYNSIPPIENLEMLERDFTAKIVVAYEELMKELTWADNIYEASVIVIKHKELFSEDEVAELEQLFHIRDVCGEESKNARDRFMYWNEDMLTTRYLERKIVAQMAIKAYSRQ